jgi:hypothetical protein
VYPLCRDPHASPTYARGFREIRLTINTCVGSGTLFYSEGMNCSSVRTRAKSVPAYIVKFRRASQNRKESPEFKDSFKVLSTKMVGFEGKGTADSYSGCAEGLLLSRRLFALRSYDQVPPKDNN